MRLTSAPSEVFLFQAILNSFLCDAYNLFVSLQKSRSVESITYSLFFPQFGCADVCFQHLTASFDENRGVGGPHTQLPH